jgi:hypothetical protein
MMGRHMAIGKDTVVVQVTSGKKVIIPSKSKLGTRGTKVYALAGDHDSIDHAS